MTISCAARRWALALALGVALSACTAGPPTAAPASPPSSSPATSPAGAAPRSAPSTTLFGAAYKVEAQEPEDVALQRTEAILGRLDVVRVFNAGFPAPWPGKAPGRNVVVSFKLEPARVLAGEFDAAMRDWFRSAPRDLDVHWAYWHEPEDDVEDGLFTAEEYKAAFAHLSGLAREVVGPRTRSTVILQSYTTRPASGRNWRDYYPGNEVVDVLAWDVYNRPERAGGYTPPAELLGTQIEIARSLGKPFGVAEVGSVLAEGDDGTERGQWLRELGEYLKAQGAVFVTYFDLAYNGGRDDYRLRDEPSLRAWRDVTASS